jgi:hypothetical protein
MPTPPISTTGLRMPDDFEYDSYEAVHSRMAPLNKSYPTQWPEWAAAWVAVAYRFYACTEHAEAFTKSLQTHGDAPQEPERYRQEQHLFGFFVNGLSVIESTCYGLFAIASMENPASFPLTTPAQKRAVNPKSTTLGFCTEFPAEGVSSVLSTLIATQDYKDWQSIRNILAHRQSPGRQIPVTVGSPQHAQHDALWGSSGIPLNSSTTQQRRIWLAENIRTLLREIEAFTKSRF